MVYRKLFPYAKKRNVRRKSTHWKMSRYRRKNNIGLSRNRIYINRWTLGRVFSRSIGIGPTPWPVNPSGEYKMLFLQPEIALSELPDYNDFVNLFKYYHIRKVVYSYQFKWNDTTSQMQIQDVQPVPSPPAIYRPWCDWRFVTFFDRTGDVDWEDSNDPNVSLNKAKQIGSFRFHHSGKRITRTCYPMSKGVITDTTGGVIDSAGLSNMYWYKTSQSGLPFYGVISGIQPVIPTANLSRYWQVQYTLDVKYYLVFNGVR